MNYFKKLWKVLNTLNEEELEIDLGGTSTGINFTQEFIFKPDGRLYEINITREELRTLSENQLRETIIYKIQNEKNIA